MLNLRPFSLLPLVVAPLVGCSSPNSNTSTTPDESCKNVITHKLSGDVYLTATHRYDDMGHLTSYIETNTYDKDVFRLSRTYDEHNRRIGQIVDTTRFDSGHREMTWEYDDEDRVIRSTYDGWGTAGKFRDTRITYDALGLRDTITIDEDGVPTDRVNYVYTQGDPFIVEEEHRNDPDQTIKYGFRYFLGQSRWLERVEIFNAEIVQSAEWYIYEDMNNGVVSHRYFDPDANGVPDDIDSFKWNAAGLLERAEYDTDANGTIDQSNTYEYDGMGRITKRIWNVYDQGILEFVTTFEWSEGALKYVERADASTGQAIESWSFSYGCASEWAMDVPISPIQGFRYEMQTLPFSVDSSTWWKSFDSL